MGGRGTVLGDRNKRGVKVMSLDEFLGPKGLASPISDWLDDKWRGNKNFSSGNQREKFREEARKNIDEYHDKRNAAIKEYKNLLASGKIREPTSLERSLKTAQGHPDNKSVQAARRMLTKRGYDWKTGKKIKAPEKER